MPLYEYQCEKCAHRFEVIQKFSDAPIEVCPKCGGHVVKLLSSPAIQFKGTGWYVTDYSSKGKAGTESSNSSKGETKKSDSGSGSSETSAKTESGASAPAKSSSET